MPSNSKNWTASGPDGISLVTSTTSTVTQICTTDSAAMARDVMIENRGASDVYVKTGSASNITATSLSLRVPAGQYRIFEKGMTGGVANTYLAYLAASGTPQIVVYLGEG